MKPSTVFLVIAAHAAASVGLGFTLMFAILPGTGSPLDSIARGFAAPFHYLSRSPHSLYVLLAVGCVLLVPLRAGIVDICALWRGRTRPFWWGLAATVATAALVPFAFRSGVDLLTPYFAGSLTIYAHHTVFSFMPVGLGIWAFISIPITLLTSHLLRGRLAPVNAAGTE